MSNLKNKTRKSALIAMMAVICMMFAMTACKDDNGIPNVPNTEMQTVNTGGSTGTVTIISGVPSYVANTNNPYDIYGQICVGSIKNFFENAQYNGNNFENWFQEYKTLRLNFLINRNPFNQTAEYYRQMNEQEMGLENQKFYGYVEPYMQNATIQEVIMTLALNPNANAQTYISLVKTIENQFLNSVGNFSTDEQIFVAKKLAIARYAAWFWEAQRAESNSAYHTYLENATDIEGISEDIELSGIAWQYGHLWGWNWDITRMVDKYLSIYGDFAVSCYAIDIDALVNGQQF